MSGLAKLVAWLVAFVVLGGGAGAKSALVIEDYARFVRVSAPVAIEAGRYVAYEHRAIDIEGHERWRSEIRLIDTRSRAETVIGPGRAPRWAPDGRRLVYIGTQGAERGQLVIHDRVQGQRAIVTKLAQAATMPAWSPDGQHIAFKMFVPVPAPAGPALPPPQAGATRSPEPVVIDTFNYKEDGTGLLPSGNDHLFVLTIASGKIRQVTRGDFHVGARYSGQFADVSQTVLWSADGASLYFDGLAAPDHDRRLDESYIYEVPAAGGAVRQVVGPPAGGSGDKAFWVLQALSPDGRTLAFTGYRWRGNHRQLTEALWLAGIDGAAVRKVSGILDSNVTSIAWAPSGDIYLTVPLEGHDYLYRIRDGRAPERLSDGSTSLRLGAFVKSGLALGITGGFADPGDVALIDVTAGRVARRLTRANPWLADRELGSLERFTFRSRDGTRIGAQIIRPPGFDPAKRYPLIFRPNSAGAAPSFSFEHLHYAAQGYTVLLLHYRSDQSAIGFGEAATNSGYNGFPNERVFDDVMAGVDAAIGRGAIDPERLFIVGASQGGEVAAWTIARTKRFAAAAILRPVTDHIGKVLSSDEALWYLQLYDRPFWEDPSRWLAHSPIMQAHKVETPTLVMAGDADLRTPVSQAEGYYRVLKYLGRAPTRLVLLPGVDHGPGDDMATFLRYQLYVLDWLERWDPARSARP